MMSSYDDKNLKPNVKQPVINLSSFLPQNQPIEYVLPVVTRHMTGGDG